MNPLKLLQLTKWLPPIVTAVVVLIVLIVIGTLMNNTDLYYWGAFFAIVIGATEVSRARHNKK